MRNDKAISQLLALNDMVAALDNQVLGVRNQMLFFHAGDLIAHDNDTLVLLYAAEVDHTVDLGNFS